MEIYKSLNSCSIKWTSIDPVTFADTGEKTLFCQLLIRVGVKHKTLSFEEAVAAADTIKGILSLAGFPEIKVAFCESEVTHSVGGPKLLSLNPLIDPIPKFHKPFTPMLGFSIMPLKRPHYKGTGALYFHLSKDNNCIVLLTTVHITYPPSVYPNMGMSYRTTYQPCEEIVPLGNMAYQNATNTMMAKIGDLACSVTVWEKVITRLGKFVDDEDVVVTKKHQENQHEVEKVMKTIDN
jgi:hypothetical protein